MQQRALEGTVVENPNGEASETKRLRDMLANLTRELNDALQENAELRKRVAQADAPIARLREKLAPFYQLLQSLFGDIDEIAPDGGQSATSSAPVGDSRTVAVWQSWKEKMPGPPANIIQALLTHGDANVAQLAIICKHDPRTIYKGIARLKGAGLLNKNGGRFSLKQL